MSGVGSGIIPLSICHITACEAAAAILHISGDREAVRADRRGEWDLLGQWGEAKRGFRAGDNKTVGLFQKRGRGKEGGCIRGMRGEGRRERKGEEEEERTMNGMAEVGWRQEPQAIVA